MYVYMHEIIAVILSRGNLSRLDVCKISPWSSMPQEEFV